MHSVRSLPAVTGAILGLAVLAPSASQAADPVFTPFTVVKECGEFAGTVPSFCTITGSSFWALIRAKVNYYGPQLGGNGEFVSSSVVIRAAGLRNSTALGHCIVYFAAGPAGMCTFNGGSGRLAGFQAVVKVTVDADMIWHWEGVETHNTPSDDD
jgi:hypothetical protein